MWRTNFVDSLWKDVRHAARVLRRGPGFAAMAVFTLALGLGATTAIFSVVYGVLLKPLPFPEPERLVGLYHRGPGVDLAVMNHGAASYFTYLDNQQSFEGIGAWDRQEVSVTGLGEPERVEALAVTQATLPLLRVQPALGRLFTQDDDMPGSPLRVILTHGYWRRVFGGTRDIVGQRLEIDGAPADVIGVLPASFRFLRMEPAVLLPLQPDRADATFASFGFQALARLKPGVALAEANADIARMIPILEQIPGHVALKLEPYVRPLAEDVIGSIGSILWILLGTVSIVLLIAGANVANLFLVHAERRGQELAIRAALGASQARISRELLVESLMLGLGGGLVGLVLAQACIDLLRTLAPASVPRVDEIALDPAVLLFAAAISLLTGLLFGCIPMLRLREPNSTALKEGGRQSGDGPVRRRTRHILVVAEVAMALMLLIVSGLMIRTFLAMQQVEPGFARPSEVQTFRIEIPGAAAPDPVEMARRHEQIAERLRAVPGVTSVGLSSSITMDGEDNTNPLNVEGFPTPDGEMPPLRRFKSVAPGYFETMGNPLLAGRAVTWSDIYEARPVVVISETLAREYWGSAAAALGKRVRGSRPTWYEVVGVSGDERDEGLSQPATAIVYWPMLSENYGPTAISYVVRSSRVGARGFSGELRQAVWSVDSNLPLANVMTLEEIQADSLAQISFAMVMLAIAAGGALLLSLVGIYGVIAYIATQRTREIGIRIALGARSGDVPRLFLGHGLRLTAAGIALGIIASLAATRVLSALLFGVSPVDPLTYTAASAGLTGVALLATYLPALRASRIDPLLAIRGDA